MSFSSHRPPKVKAKKSKATKAGPTFPVTPVASKNAQQKTKASAGRCVLNFLKKAVPCISSAKHHVEEPVQGSSDVIDISPRSQQRESVKALPPAAPKARATEREKTTPSMAPPARSTSTPNVGRSIRNRKGDSSLPTPLPIARVNPSTANVGVSVQNRKGDSSLPTPLPNSPAKPSTANVGVSVQNRKGDSPVPTPLPIARADPSTANGGSSSPTPELKAAPKKLIVHGLNLYATPCKFAAVLPPMPIVDDSLVDIIVREMATKARALAKHSKSLRRKGSRPQPSERRSTMCKYVIRNGGADVVFNQRKPFVTYIHFQTLTSLEEEEVDEPLEEDFSPSTPASDSSSISTQDSNSDSIPANGDSASLLFTKEVEHEEVELEQNHTLADSNSESIPAHRDSLVSLLSSKEVEHEEAELDQIHTLAYDDEEEEEEEIHSTHTDSPNSDGFESILDYYFNVAPTTCEHSDDDLSVLDYYFEEPPSAFSDSDSDDFVFPSTSESQSVPRPLNDNSSLSVIIEENLDL